MERFQETPTAPEGESEASMLAKSIAEAFKGKGAYPDFVNDVNKMVSDEAKRTGASVGEIMRHLKFEQRASDPQDYTVHSVNYEE